VSEPDTKLRESVETVGKSFICSQSLHPTMSALHRRQLLAGIGRALSVGLAGCGGDRPSGESPTVNPALEGTPTPTETASNTARVRVAHMSPDAPALVTTVDGEIVEGSLAVPFRGVGDYTAVTAGTRRVTITTEDDGTVLFDREVTLAATDYTLVAAGERVDDDPAFRVVELIDDNDRPDATTSLLRLVHVSPDAGALDVQVGSGAAQFDGVEFTDSVTESVPADQYGLIVQSERRADDDPDYTRAVSLDGASIYTVFASGYLDVEFASDTSFELTVVRD
jgi:hypothetical protein